MLNEPTIPAAITLADWSVREASTGKLTLVGMFSMWHLPSFPFPVPRFFVSAHVGNLKVSNEKFTFAIRLEHKRSMHVAASVLGQLNIGSNAREGDGVDLLVPLNGVVFHEAGLYVVRVFVDDLEVGNRDVWVHALTGNPPTTTKETL